MSTHPDPVLRAIETFKYNPSTLKIKEFMTNKSMSFSFGCTTRGKTYKALKTCQENDIPVKIIKSHKEIFSYFIHRNFSNSLYSSIFPSELKKADIIPIHKKKSKFDIENYCPVSILPVLSKIYERFMFDQMYSYFNQILSKYQCGFRQGHSTQHNLLLMVEKWKKVWTIVV